VKLREGVDYYIDNGRLVWTEAYLKKRGMCCKSGCRHCPWKIRKEEKADK
jgi:hypothetical protein